MYRLKIFVGWLMAVVGAFMVAVWVQTLVDGDPKNSVLTLFFCAAFAGGGVLLLRSGSRDQRALGLTTPSGVQATPEKLVLQVAQRQGGTVTAAEVAADSPLSFDEAQQELDSLARKGACDVDATDQGAVVYRFAGLLPKG